MGLKQAIIGPGRVFRPAALVPFAISRVNIPTSIATQCCCVSVLGGFIFPGYNVILRSFLVMDWQSLISFGVEADVGPNMTILLVGMLYYATTLIVGILVCPGQQ